MVDTAMDELKNPELVEAEIVDPVDPITALNHRFIGKVKTCHNGYSFLDSIKEGYATINTNGDVFVPEELPVGQWVGFNELNTDPERIGKFRTEQAFPIDDKLVIAERISAIEVLAQISSRSTYHLTAKEVAPDLVNQAKQNIPFKEVIAININLAQQQPDVTKIAEEFLKATFANLASIQVNYSLSDMDADEGEEAKVEDAKKMFAEDGMQGQVESTTEQYRQFLGIRGAFRLMCRHNLLSLTTVVPISCLPDLVMAAPVWYSHAQEALDINERQDDPKVSHFVRFLCDQIGSKEFAWLFQIYNRRTRPLSTFKGKDIIPLPLMNIMREAKKTFDYVAIATPYHDIASREWVDPNWLRNIDPYLLGFMKGLPFIFVLGRWSGTGLFPLVCDMVADTIDHLRLNKKKLQNFMPNSWWYKGLGNNGEVLAHQNGQFNTILEPFVNNLIEAFEAGNLFAFLRGELTPKE